MKCQCCSAPATVHLTNVEASGKRREIHLCEACAEKNNVLQKKELNLSSILQALISMHVGQRSDELARKVCPVCGIRFMEFRAEGRLGCPHDYEVFHAGLEPLLQRIHRADHHVGKRPRQRHQASDSHRQLLELRRQLQQAVRDEAYERAAKIRDLIRQKEKQG